MNIVEERSHYFITLTFTDESGTAVTPGSAYYRVDDLLSKSQMRGDTAISISGSTGSIHLNGVDTEMVDEANVLEHREMYIHWEYASGTKSNSKVINYAVKNIWQRTSVRLYCDSGVYAVTGKTVTF